MAGDLYFDKVALLLHCEGADGSTTFTDSSPGAKTVTRNGDAQVDTAAYKFGSASALFDGTDDYLSAARCISQVAFTAECWVYVASAATAQAFIAQRDVISGAGVAGRLGLYINSSGKLEFFIGSTSSLTVTDPNAFPTSQWVHVAVTRESGGNVHLYRGGSRVGTGNSTQAPCDKITTVGAQYAPTDAILDRPLNGWLDEIRITDGVARYTGATYDIPTAAFPDGYQLAASVSTEAHQSPGVILKNIYCPPVSQANESPFVVITQAQELTVGTDSQANQSAGGIVGIVTSITINLDTRTRGQSGIGITINPRRSGSTTIPIGIGPYTGTSTITITINPRRSGTTTIPIGIYGDLTAEAGAQAVTWKPKCLLNGVDISGKLVGAIEIETEEMAAPVASFSFLPAAGTVDPLAWVGQSVTLSWQRYVSGVLAGERLRFSGLVSDPAWDADQRLISISATGDLQSILDGMTKTAIADTVPNGTWSDTVFGDPEDIGGWDYAEALLSTTNEVIWQDASGALRVTSTLAKGSADFTFTDSGRFEDSLRLDYASRMDFTTQAIITMQHRFKRRRQRNVTFSWMPAELETPCHYLTGGYPLPQRTMVESAANGGGYTVIGSIYYREVWPAGSYRCMTQDPATGSYAYTHLNWVNTPSVTDEWCTGAVWTGAKRWTQDVTEEFTLTLNASESQATIGVLPIEETYTVESEDDDETWESSLDYSGYATGATLMVNGVDYRSDLDETSRAILDDAQEVALARARNEILKSHRGTSVTFSTVYQPMLDLSHTVEVDCAALECQGKVRRIRDRWDIDTGDCTSEIQVALYRHNGAGLTSDDTLEAVDKPADPTETVPETRFRLQFYVGGKADSFEWDDDWDIPGCYATNYPDDGSGWNVSRSNPVVAARIYDEGFRLTPPEIDEEYADPVDVTAAQTFEVAIPEDTLVLTSY